jgi:predicted ATPase with chaperone activity
MNNSARGETARAQALVTRHRKRISAPLPDRIDMAYRIDVLPLDCEKLSGDRMGESCESIRTRLQARARA